jgi:hypothetical protein
MLKYFLAPLPLILGLLAQLVVQWAGEAKIDRNEIHPRHVYHFADFCMLVGAVMSAVWLCGCVVSDVFDRFDRWNERRLIRKEEERRK